MALDPYTLGRDVGDLTSTVREHTDTLRAHSEKLETLELRQGMLIRGCLVAVLWIAGVSSNLAAGDLGNLIAKLLIAGVG